MLSVTVGREVPVKADSASEIAREASSAVCSRTPCEEYCAGSKDIITTSQIGSTTLIVDHNDDGFVPKDPWKAR
jgi:hypothetical protein